jgi:hypothetical protein
MKRPSPPDRPPPQGPADPVFELRSVRPRRDASSSWITVGDEDLIDDESREIVRPRLGARRVIARIVGYVVILALFWGTARLLAQRPIRDAIVDWTTFGLGEYVRSTEKRIADFFRRWRSR